MRNGGKYRKKEQLHALQKTFFIDDSYRLGRTFLGVESTFSRASVARSGEEKDEDSEDEDEIDEVALLCALDELEELRTLTGTTAGSDEEDDERLAFSILRCSSSMARMI